MKRLNKAVILLSLTALPCPSWAGRTVQPHASGIVIHLFGNEPVRPVQPDQSSGISMTAPKRSIPVSAGLARALAKMLNNAGRPTGLSGRQANLPVQAISSKERHPAP